MRMPWRAALPLATPRTEAGAQRKAEPFRRRRTMEKTMRKMKDSGVEWIGEIPEDWEVGKVKQLFSVVNGATPKSDVPAYWNGDILWVTPADISDESYFIEKSKKYIKSQT